MGQPDSIFDHIDPDAKCRAVEEARQELAAGDGIAHADAMAWLDALARGDVLPFPK